MLTLKSYLLFWFVYLAAATVLMYITFRVTQGWRPVAIRLVLRTLAAVWLFMPAVVDPDAPRESLAPAFIVVLFEFSDGYAAAARVLEPVLVLSIAAIPVVLLTHVFWLRWRSRRAPQPGTQA